MHYKSLPISQVQIKADGSSFEGYASVFGGIDSYGDTIARGAYAYTLKNNAQPKMFFNHDSYSLPIGKWTKLSEDDHGLHVAGELTAGNSFASDVAAALAHGTVDGLSIGYRLKPTDYETLESGGRLIKRVSQLSEVSVVTYPADNAARVDLESVKSEIEALTSLRDFEDFLRDAGKFSKGLASALAARMKFLLLGDPEVEAEAKAQREFMERLSRLQEKVTA